VWCSTAYLRPPWGARCRPCRCDTSLTAGTVAGRTHIPLYDLVLSCLSGHQACPRCIGCSVPAAIWAVALRGPPSRGFISSALAWVRQDHDRIGSRPEEYVEADETGFTKLSHSNGTIRVIPPMMVDWQEDVWNAMLWKSK
jgi:hypothetical protein